MKTIITLILSLIMLKGCSQKDIQDTTITYVATTRGFYQKITIKNQEISINKNRNDEGLGETRKIADNDWNELVNLFSKIDLENFSNYEGPTKKRQYDGAAFANITIHYQDKDYENASFDHGYPPVEIQEFVNKVVDLSKNDKE